MYNPCFNNRNKKREYGSIFLRWSFGKYESHNLSANQKCHGCNQSHRRDFATKKHDVVCSDIGWSRFAKPLWSRFSREATLYGWASLGIPPDVKQSVDEWYTRLVG